MTVQSNMISTFTLILCQGFIQYTLSCIESRETVEYVKFCPINESEWFQASQRKNCSSVQHACETFFYHCVMNAYVTDLLEVCAPRRNILEQKCAEYNYVGSVVQGNEQSSCKNHTTPCEFGYKSDEAFKYQECYDLVYSKKKLQFTTLSGNKSENVSNFETNEDHYSSTSEPTFPKRYGYEQDHWIVTVLGIGAGVIFTVILIVIYRRKKSKNKRTPSTNRITEKELLNAPDQQEGTEKDEFERSSKFHDLTTAKSVSVQQDCEHIQFPSLKTTKTDYVDTAYEQNKPKETLVSVDVRSQFMSHSVSHLRYNHSDEQNGENVNEQTTNNVQIVMTKTEVQNPLSTEYGIANVDETKVQNMPKAASQIGIYRPHPNGNRSTEAVQRSINKEIENNDSNSTKEAQLLPYGIVNHSFRTQSPAYDSTNMPTTQAQRNKSEEFQNVDVRIADMTMSNLGLGEKKTSNKRLDTGQTSWNPLTRRQNNSIVNLKSAKSKSDETLKPFTDSQSKEIDMQMYNNDQTKIKNKLEDNDMKLENQQKESDDLKELKKQVDFILQENEKLKQENESLKANNRKLMLEIENLKAESATKESTIQVLEESNKRRREMNYFEKNTKDRRKNIDKD